MKSWCSIEPKKVSCEITSSNQPRLECWAEWKTQVQINQPQSLREGRIAQWLETRCVGKWSQSLASELQVLAPVG